MILNHSIITYKTTSQNRMSYDQNKTKQNKVKQKNSCQRSTLSYGKYLLLVASFVKLALRDTFHVQVFCRLLSSTAKYVEICACIKYIQKNDIPNS